MEPSAKPKAYTDNMKTMMTLIFDGDCAFCTKWAVWSKNIAPIRIVPWQWSEEYLAEKGIALATARRYVLLVSETSHRVYLGHKAVGKVLKSSRFRRHRLLGNILGWKILGPLMRLGYLLVARNRHLLPGGTPMCRM